MRAHGLFVFATHHGFAAHSLRQPEKPKRPSNHLTGVF
nr:MAG TPA: hypothetical protein [Caudoviricetes sp.]